MLARCDANGYSNPMEEKEEQLRLSVSKTKTFEQCRKQFHFSYILKMPRKDRSYHITGKFVHQILEDFHKAYIDGSTSPINQEIGRAYKKAREEYGEKMTPEMLQECRSIINDYLKLIVTNGTGYNTLKNVLSVEKNFLIDIGNGVALNGFIDRIQLDDDGIIHVIDYKTTVKGAKYLRKDFGQLQTYAYAILQEDPSIRKIRGSYMLLRHDFELITAEFDLEEILSIREKYLNYAEAITNEKEYPANPSKLCSFCDFLDICSDGQAKVKPKPSLAHGPVNW
jgi:RecB family exonuclease